MFIEIVSNLHSGKLAEWKRLIGECGLSEMEPASQTALLWDDDELIGTGGRDKNLIKYIAISPQRQGEDLLSTVITQLRKNAFEDGYNHLFLYTKPSNKDVFSSLFFYPIVQTDKVLFMENKRGGIQDFINSHPKADPNQINGALVMNCNPFTLGHQYIIEKAASECDRVFVFVLSEDSEGFSAHDRFEMVKNGVSHIPNVSVCKTGPYLISSATFPTYFLKDRDSASIVQCDVDIEIFTKYFAPHFNITRRYVGTEPYSPMTEKYNQILVNKLPDANIELRIVERKTSNDVAVSASLVRKIIKNGEISLLKNYLPQTTIDYLQNNKLI